MNNEKYEFFGMFTNNRMMKNVYSQIESVAGSETSLMLTGETGVGKDWIGRLIHSISERKNKPYIEINCGAIPDHLIESELFGYVRGAFSGASEAGKKGLIESAQGGTLFLDEIGEMPMDMQRKLLQVVQEKRIVPVGGIKYIEIDFRLISATNRDLAERIKEKKFREDLYYRINVVPIHIPPLRARKEDIVMLVMQFLEKFNETYGKHKVLTGDSINMLMQYEWPGNIRELQNITERIVIMSKNDVVEKSELLQLFPELYIIQNQGRHSLKQRVEAYEKEIVLEAFSRGLSTTQMAMEFCIGQSSVVRKLQKYLEEI